MKLICGLGNPGDKYDQTRHNIGFRILDELARQEGADFSEKWNGQMAEISIDGEKTLLLKPNTFMNLSGQAVVKFAHYYKIEPEDILVVYDDVDLPLGEIRFRKSGGPGTHNGMKSIIQELGGQNFPRLRIGIESRGVTAPEQMGLADFVLARFTKEEEEKLESLIDEAVKTLKNPLA